MQTQANNSELSFEKVWQMFQETDLKFKETDLKFQETEKLVKELVQQSKETDKQLKNLGNKMSESESRWSKFVESLVEGALINLLKKAGIKVYGTSQRQKRMYQGDKYEIDIIAKNGTELVAVEVKTTLGVEDVKHFMKVLKLFKKIFEEYSTNKIFGAVAFINTHADAEKLAEKNGLFVIRATGESAILMNRPDFKPKEW